MPPSLKENAPAIARELGIPPDMPLAQMLHTAFELLGIPPPPDQAPSSMIQLADGLVAC